MKLKAKYRLGSKVRTRWGIGVIIKVQEFETITQYKVKINNGETFVSLVDDGSSTDIKGY